MRFAKPMIDYAGYLGLRAVIAAIQAAPLSVCERGAGVLAWLCAGPLRIRRGVVEENLRTAFPDWDEAQRRRATRRMWRHLFLMVAEIAHTPRKVHRTTWRDWIDLRGERAIVSIMLREGPKVVISAHYGNFELGGYLLGLFGVPTHTIARTLDNPYVDGYVNEFRGRTGQYILPKTGSGDDVQRVLEGGGVLTLLGDQHAGPKGCWVDFFGKPASTHKAVSLFSLTHKAPTVVVGVRRRSDAALRYTVFAADTIDPSAEGFELGTTTLFTEWFTQRLEGVIRGEPTQYWWVHKRWKPKPVGWRQRARDASAKRAADERAA